MASKTKKPTGLSITRSGNTYTFKWKIASKDHKGGQKLEYTVYTPNSGQGASPAISNTATSYSVTVANVRSISFRVRGKRGKNGNTTYDYSDWASASWDAVVPKTPTLTYKNEGTNKGTITWSCPADSSDNAIFTGAEYQTCIERNSAASGFGGAVVQTKGAAGSELVIEASSDMAAGNFVRWFRIRAYGPAGYSPWVTAYHAYGAPLDARVTEAQLVYSYGSSSRAKVSWTIGHNTQYPVDELTLQYVTAVPTDNQLTAPVSGWSDAVKLDAKAWNDTAVANIPDAVGDDECIWVRIVADHDGLKSYSAGYVAAIGSLKAPTIDAVPNTSSGDVQITITEETACDVAMTAIFFRPQNNPSNDRLVAIFQNGTTTGTVNVPEVIGAAHTCFGAYAFVGSSFGKTITRQLMISDKVIDSDIPAVAPANVGVDDSPVEGSARVSWAWSWSAASEAEIAWADNEYAWESTAEPSTYRVKDKFATSWIVAGLATDKTWYFRVRLVDTSGDTEVVGPWSEVVSYNLAGNPERPALFLSKSVANPGDTIVARWAFISSGKDEQEYAEICLVTYDEDTGDPIYGEVIATAGPEQSVDITREWEPDTTYYLALRTTSNTGRQSEWSEVASLYVVEPVTISLDLINMAIGHLKVTHNEIIETLENDFIIDSDTSFEEIVTDITTMTSEYFEMFMAGSYSEDITIEHDVDPTIMTVCTNMYDREFEHEPWLSALPITATITGAGTSGLTTLSIIRAGNRRIDRPNDKDFDGYDGEVIATHAQIGEAQITISAADLIGSLDDGGGFYLVGKVVDEYGQTASFRYPFWVNWASKSFIPEVSVEMDPYSRIAKITPTAPTGSPTATCDIYRISADTPELIVKGATFGMTYVDPYPAFGEAGGHRLVAITANGDYATASGLGWYDTGIDDGDILRDESMVIDVDGEQIVLPYNLELSNKWNKDFKRTSYLGGSVQGDWNPAVTRDISANTVLVRGDDLDRQLSMRDLAGYAGIAHVRTPDGSSLTVNVQIDERQSYDSRKISYTLTMQAIDPEALDGMTLTEWEEMHPIVET